MAIFDKEAINYDSWYTSKMGDFVDKVETELAMSLFKIEPGMKILDVGCGTGNFSIKLAEQGCRVVAIDQSKEMLENAIKKSEKKGLDIEFYCMDVYDMKSWNSKEVIACGECLFLPPTMEEDFISLELEKELSVTEKGGFISVMWQKGI